MTKANPYTVLGRNGYAVFSGSYQDCAAYVADIDGANRFGWAIRQTDRRDIRVRA